MPIKHISTEGSSVNQCYITYGYYEDDKTAGTYVAYNGITQYYPGIAPEKTSTDVNIVNSKLVVSLKIAQTVILNIDLDNNKFTFTDPSTVTKQPDFNIPQKIKLKYALSLHGLDDAENIKKLILGSDYVTKNNKTSLTTKAKEKILEIILLIEELYPKQANLIDPINHIDQESYTLLVDIINKLEYDEDMEDFNDDEILLVLAVCGLLNKETLTYYDELRSKMIADPALKKKGEEIFQDREFNTKTRDQIFSQMSSMREMIIALLPKQQSTEKINNSLIRLSETLKLHGLENDDNVVLIMGGHKKASSTSEQNKDLEHIGSLTYIMQESFENHCMIDQNCYEELVKFIKNCIEETNDIEPDDVLLLLAQEGQLTAENISFVSSNFPDILEKMKENPDADVTNAITTLKGSQQKLG